MKKILPIDEDSIHSILTPQGMKDVLHTARCYALEHKEKKGAHLLVVQPELTLIPAPFVEEDNVQLALCLNILPENNMEIISAFAFDGNSLSQQEVIDFVGEMQPRLDINFN